jgi:acetylornithine deacetylase
MKSGVAAMCVAAAAVASSGIRLAGDLVVAPVSAEEDGGAGTFALLTGHEPLRLRPGSAAIIPEPSDSGLVVANAGSLTFRITLTGRAAHGALRWQGVSALERVPVVLKALRALEDIRCREAGPLFAHLPLAYPISVGTIAGGDWASTVPGAVVLTGRYGVRLGEPADRARAAFEAAVARAAESDDWLRDHPPVVEWWGAEFASAVTDPQHRVVSALRSSGARGAAVGAPYGSDMRLLVGLAGIPTVIYGPGSPQQAHTDSESVQWSAVMECARTLARTAVRFCRPEPVDNPPR